MRTTISIDDDVLQTAKQRAADEGRTLGELITEALRERLARRPLAGAERYVALTAGEGGPLPGCRRDQQRRRAGRPGRGVILPDVNVLVLAHRADQEEHEPMRTWLEGEVNSDRPFFLADVAMAGFLRIVTNPRIYHRPTPLETAVAFVDGLVVQPTCVPVAAGARHWPISRADCSAAPTFTATSCQTRTSPRSPSSTAQPWFFVTAGSHAFRTSAGWIH